MIARAWLTCAFSQLNDRVVLCGVISNTMKVATGAAWKLRLIISAWLKRVDVEMTEFQYIAFLEGVFPKREAYACARVPKEDQAANLDQFEQLGTFACRTYAKTWPDWVSA